MFTWITHIAHVPAREQTRAEAKEKQRKAPAALEFVKVQSSVLS